MNPTDCSAACQIAERRLPHFTATLHKRVALWCWRAPLQDSLWTSGKLRWINGYCSRVSCWGLAVLLWADHADLCYYQLTTSPALRMSQSGVTPWALCLFSIWKKKRRAGGLLTRPSPGHQGSRRRCHPWCFWLSDSAFLPESTL